MFRGFNLTLDGGSKFVDEFFKLGQKLFDKYQTGVRETFDRFVIEEGTLEGSKMQEYWFPQINADIFISHSHSDQKKAIALAGWLYSVFGIKSFIDSCIWGYADDLLKQIDKKHCFQKANNTYCYKSRNYSTSHVHMMLSVALTMMIDNTECVFFLNTPNSISASTIISQTESPWIYSEIAITQMIRRKIPSRMLVKKIRKYSKGGKISEKLKIKYDVDLLHLTKINSETLNDWQRDFNKTTANDALDKLFALKPLERNNIILG